MISTLDDSGPIEQDFSDNLALADYLEPILDDLSVPDVESVTDEQRVRFIRAFAQRLKTPGRYVFEDFLAEQELSVSAAKPLILDVLRLGESKARIKHALKAPSEPDLEEAIHPFPQFPRLVGILDDLALEIAPSLAYEQKALYLLVAVGLHISGRVKLATDPWLQPRFYGCAIAPPGQTKSAVDREIRKVLFPEPQDIGGRETYAFQPLPEPKIAVEFSVNSGPALVQMLEENRRLLLVPDELAGMFEKARQTVTSPNTLFNELLRLYESNETGRAVVQRRGEKGTHIRLNDAHLAVYGGATPQSFDKMWQGTAGAGAGLQSRFVLAYSDCPPPPFQKLSNHDEIRRLAGILVERLRDVPDTLTMTGEAQQSVIEWAEKRKDIPARALDMAKRAAMVLAATGELRIVESAAMTWGLAFAEYQIELKDRLMPADADNNVQAFENRIVGVYKRNGKATQRQVRRALHPERYPGGYAAYAKAMAALTNSGRLKSVDKTHSGTSVFDLD